MSDARIGLARVLGLGIALAVALLLLAAREAEAAKYSVAQCGWRIGADASWVDTTGGAKFRPDAYCVTPANADPFDGVHMKSFTKSASTVSGTRFARWRWEAPSGTAISRVSGTWWQALHDGMEQRIGVGTWGGGFDPFAIASSTNATPRSFVAGFSPAQPALEDRLLCARAESKSCDLTHGSWSAIRALTITLEDNAVPSAWLGGDLLAGGWRKGDQGVLFSGTDVGAGVRLGETFVGDTRVVLTEYPCAKAQIGGEWQATRMRPCETSVSGSATIDTRRLSDGSHTFKHCVLDFPGNGLCSAEHRVHIDNNPPAHPRALALAGDDGWRRVNDFDFSWENPDQGPASPIAGAYWRITGGAGYDTGIGLAAGRDIAALADRRLPRPGVYLFHVWLRDEAGNDAPASKVELPIRFDDSPPRVAFAAADGPGIPEEVRAALTDPHSGPGRGSIHYRRLGSERWIELATRMVPGEESGTAHLSAGLPENLVPGIYVFRVDATDVAGNSTSSTRRGDGTEMALRLTAPVAVEVRRSAGDPVKTRLFARLRWRARGGPSITVPFGGRASLGGRLFDIEGAGLRGRLLRVVSRPSRGALAETSVIGVRTGDRGGFALDLPPGTSRRITVSFAGEDGLDSARRPALALRVRGGVLLQAAPRSLRTGEVLRFWGRVRGRGAPLPRRGKLIAIQYYESSARRWRPVLLLRSDRSGRFRARYRFRYVSGSARIRLRAVALAEERWPYAPGASRPVAVRVDG